ncbi:MAG: DNA polymerase III subunit delta [Acidobacteriota bacterium]
MILQSLEALQKDLETSSARSYYLILGQEQFLCRLACDLIKKRLINPEAAAFDFTSFSIKDASVQKIFETANTFPMLSNRRLVLVTDVEKLPERDHEKFLAHLDSLQSCSMVVLIADELDRRKKFYKALQAGGCIVEFKKLKGASLERWVEAYTKKKGYRISTVLIGKIVNIAGSDLQSMVGELEKLFLFAGKDKTITESAVEDLVRNSRQHGIFELIDAIGKRDRAAALRSLSNLLESGEYPLMIVSMMARHSRQVLIVKECLKRGMNFRDAGRAAQIPPFILDKFVRQAKAIDTGTVSKMHKGLHDIDRMLKSSSVDARTLLEVFICALV